MSNLAKYALRKAYEQKAPEKADEVLQLWTDLSLLKDEKIVLGIAEWSKKQYDILRELGVDIPGWLPMELAFAIEELELTDSKKKRQRDAKPSNKQDLNDVLKTLAVKPILTFTVPLDFMPCQADMEAMAEILRRSLFTKLQMAPEQPAREFLAQSKRLLQRASYHSEVRMPGDQVKRADAIVASNSSARGIIELKRYMESTTSDEFRRTLAQIAVYVATGYFEISSAPFVILTGWKSVTGACFNATFGVCHLEKDLVGDIYVNEIQHEAEVQEVLFMKEGETVRFDKIAFIQVLARISALGQTYIECDVAVETDSEVE